MRPQPIDHAKSGPAAHRLAATLLPRRPFFDDPVHGQTEKYQVKIAHLAEQPREVDWSRFSEASFDAHDLYF